MSKKLLTALLVLVVVVLAMALLMLVIPRHRQNDASESSAESLAETELLVIPDSMPEGISFSIPEGFTETSSRFYQKYYVKDDASIIVTGEQMEYGVPTVDDYTQKVIEQYEETAEDFLLTADETFTVSGTPAHLLEFTYAISGDDARQEFGCTTAIMIYNDRSYLITCKSRLENYEKYREYFRMMMNTVSLSDVPERDAENLMPDESAAAEKPAETVQP